MLSRLDQKVRGPVRSLRTPPAQPADENLDYPCRISFSCFSHALLPVQCSRLSNMIFWNSMRYLCQRGLMIHRTLLVLGCLSLLGQTPAAGEDKDKGKAAG